MEWKLIAALECAAFYACYLAKLLSQRKKGIQTDQLGKGKAGVVKATELSLKWFTLLMPCIQGSSIFFLPFVDLGYLRWIGAILGFLGVGLFLLSVATMRDSWRAGVAEHETTELVTKGIYQISRNPAFLGFDLLYIGVLCMFWNGMLLAAVLIAILLFHLQIVNEEEYLLLTFGDAYLQYRKKVCRYLGRKR